jgi:hypothetical protein
MFDAVAKLVMSAGAAAGLALGIALIPASAAEAQAKPGECKPTPASFSWDYDEHCRRVPKAQVSRGPDGSVREEIRRGTCVKIKEKSGDGVKVVDRCD